MIAPMRAVNQISRRSVLGLCGVGVLTVVGACSDDSGSAPDADGASSEGAATAGPSDAPGPAPAPETADAALLVAAFDRSRVLVLRSEAVEEPERLVREALAAHTEQVRVLRAILEDAGITLPPAPELPEPAGDATTTPTSTAAPPDDSAATTARPGDRGDGVRRTETPRQRRAREKEERVARVRAQLDALAAEAAKDVTPEALADLATASPTNLALLTAIAGQRGALAMRLGDGPRWPDLAGPTGQVAVDLLEAFRPAVYGFEVLAARTAGAHREQYEGALVPLRRLTRSLTELAGDDAPPAPLGYGLPDDLDSPRGRTRLAEDLLAVLFPAVMSAADDHTGDPEAVAGTVRLIAEVGALGRAWDLAVTGFPGMDVPE